MAATGVAIGVIFLVQMVVGVLGNFSLLCHYLFLHLTGCKLRFTDWIMQHLVVANLLTLLCNGLQQIMGAFGLKNFLDDLGCKLLVYLHRVGRNVIMNSTSFLSVFQVITISPKSSRWTNLRLKSPSFIASCVSLSWILSFTINIAFPMDLTSRWSHRNITSLKGFGSKSLDMFHAVLLTGTDVMFMKLILCSSGYLISILYRHNQRMKHIHRNNSPPRSSPESKATKTILLLVSTFLCFYTRSCLFQVNLALMYNPDEFMVNLSALSSVFGGFPVVSPFLIMSLGSRSDIRK
ncbi:LOW QUALITY PROTEIN: vomeronasal type-1 receptor 4-like [Rattus rattus]|uniref:LOW QUALITY PROTEIN: vomeronasal type-1 receptor 4-like n=1 Tax=Rattus rattus TaxID=10117 RepID=UPI0013F32567|nr:LOW QUALITY PROTEIN: vomeronasal type-1 receptor 4-like [Rattus rattus]